MKITLVVVAVLVWLLAPTPVWAVVPQTPAPTPRETTVRVSGTVVGPDGAPLAGVTIATEPEPTLTSRSVQTDADGTYTFAVRVGQGELNLFVTAKGFGREAIARFNVTGDITVDIALRPAFETQLSVEADVPLLTSTGMVGEVELAPSQIAVLPSLGERDLFRAFQLLPGVSGGNETSSGLFVRGGTPDQNAVLLDGFRVYHVDHLFGYFSAFNMDAIERVSLHKGGFPARFGGAVSGIMEIEGRASNSTEAKWAGGGSLLGYFGSYESPLGEKASVLVAVRRSFQGPLYDKILGLVNRQPGPPRLTSRPGFRGGPSFDSQPKSHFYDVNAKIKMTPSRKDTVVLSLYGGGDNTDNSRDLQLPADFLERLQARGFNLPGAGFDPNNPSFNIADVRDTTNLGVGLVWTRAINARVQLRANLGFSRFTDTRSRSVGGNTQAPNGEHDALSDFTVHVDVPVNISLGHNFEAGAEITRNASTYTLQGGPPRAESGTPLADLFDQTGRGVQTTGYVQDSFLIKSKLFVVAGARATYFDRTGETYFDPRFAASLPVTSALTFKIGAGRYHQVTSQFTREDLLQGNRQFWAVADDALVPVTGSRDLVGGVTFQKGTFLVDLEGFSRKTDGLTQFTPRLNGGSDTIDYASFFHHGSSTSRGMDVLIQKKSGQHTGWIAYTNNHVAYSFPTLQAGAFPADHDRPHEVKAVSIIDVNRWTFSTTWLLATGKPYTEPIGTEAIALPDGNTIDRVVVGDKNSARLPSYHRLDVALNRRLPFQTIGKEALLNLTLFNVYNRRNVWYKEFNVLDGEITENNIRLMGLTLNASVTVKF